MRIIAGKLGGRQFKAPSGHKTHPMSDKSRGALFNALGDIDGLTVLDAFAGTGALSYEAVSRGAMHVTAIDLDKNAQRAISSNLSELDLKSDIKLIKANTASWLKTTKDNFDIVLLDPPFEDLQPSLLFRLAERTKVKGIVVFSLPPEANIPLPPRFKELATKSYGDSKLVFYRHLE